MHSIKRWLLALPAAIAVASAIAMAAAAGGPVTTTYHGTFSGAVDYVGCTTTPPTTVASGTWNVALHGTSTATVTINILTNGKHHVSFGGTFPQTTADGQVFAVEIPTQAGVLEISLVGNAFAYAISPYEFEGLSCPGGVTYHGTL